MKNDKSKALQTAVRSKGFVFFRRWYLDDPIIIQDAEHLAVWVYLLTQASHIKRNDQTGKPGFASIYKNR